MNVATMARPSGLMVVALLAVCLMTFSMGAIAGADAATNESVTLDDRLELIDVAEASATSSIHENMSKDPGADVFYKASGGDLLIHIPMEAGRYGVRWGYHHPQHALFVAENAHVLGLGLMGAYLGHMYQNRRRR